MSAAKDKTNALRLLGVHRVPYQLFTVPPEIHSATEVAQALGLPPHEVYKTPVVLRPQGRPLLVMVAGDRELDLKRVAAAVGEKKVRMATQRKAEALTGLQVGGISALALLDRPFDVCIDRAAQALSHIVVSAGKRGMNVRVAVDDLVRLTRARVIAATASE
ncbi:MAG: aminoacyl-tRNA deacylase [Anaerolineae bacterium]|nr:aminoacyl-tRNA deacylase [Anaerolineae bacterium]MDW8070340.1 YbaK/EbsC family protein [Anaerolineae bacterium]